MFKEACAQFDMCIFTLNRSTLTHKTHFVQFYLKVASNFLSWSKNKNVTLGMRLYEIYKKIKIGIPEIGAFSVITAKV